MPGAGLELCSPIDARTRHDGTCPSARGGRAQGRRCPVALVHQRHAVARGARLRAPARRRMRFVPTRSGMAAPAACGVRCSRVDPGRRQGSRSSAPSARSPARRWRSLGPHAPSLAARRQAGSLGTGGFGPGRCTGGCAGATKRCSRALSHPRGTRERSADRFADRRLRPDHDGSGPAPHAAQSRSAAGRRSHAVQCLCARRAGGAARSCNTRAALGALRGPGRAPFQRSGSVIAYCRWLLPLLLLCMAGCARLERESVAEPGYGDEAIQQQLLVMLRMPAPHFRPDVAYGSNYLRTGQDARRRIADAIADEYGLKIVDNWPMPALGVDCFVMKVPGKQLPASLIQKLSADPRVESAQTVNLFIGLAYNDPLYPLQPSATAWHLSDLHRITTGKQVRIAEVDSGVATDHPDLAGQVALARDFVGSGSGDG